MKVIEGYDLSIDTGEIDGEGNPIYESVPHVEETVANGKQIKRVGNKGHTQSANLKDDSSVDLYQDDQLLATWQIIPQYWHTNEWRDYIKVVDLLSIVDGHLVAEGEQGGFSWDIDIAWTSNDSKWEIHVVAPGFLFRFRWNIVFTELGQQLIEDGTLKLGYEDYPGETQDDFGIVERNIIFEPDGVFDELVVDPYLSLKEESTYIDITCDGYILRIWDGLADNRIGELLTLDGATMTYGFTSVIYSDELLAYASFGQSAPTISILSVSSSLISIKQSGNFNGETGSDSVDLYWNIYTDKVAMHMEWTTNSILTFSSSYTRTKFILLDNASGNLSNETYIYENNDIEARTNSTTVCADSNYFGGSSDEITAFCICLLPITRQAVVNTAQISWFFGEEVPIGSYHLYTIFVFDSVEREDITPTTTWTDTDFSVQDLVLNDSIGYECISTVTSGNSAVTEPGTGSAWTTYWIQCHKYTSTDRLAMGKQYKDLHIS